MKATFWFPQRKIEVDELTGEYIIEAEPNLALEAPAGLRYFNAGNEQIKPDQKIVGVICPNGPRGLFTDLEKQGLTVVVNEDGSLKIGEGKWWISTLFLKDKNRFIGYYAFCSYAQPTEVLILELCDLDIFLC